MFGMELFVRFDVAIQTKFFDGPLRECFVVFCAKLMNFEGGTIMLVQVVSLR